MQPQPGAKPPQVEAGNDPSQSRSKELYKAGKAPNDHAHESRENPPEGEQREKGREGTQADV